MKKVSRRLKSGRSTRFYLMLGALVLAAIGLLASALGWLRPGPGPMGDISGQRPETTLLFSSEPERIQAFSIKPGAGDGYTLVRRGDTFVLDGQESFPLDADSLAHMLESLRHITTLSSYGDISGEDVTMEDLGFDESALKVEILRDGEQPFAFAIGKRVPAADVPQDYLMLRDQALLYGIDTDMRYALDRKLESLHPVPRLDIGSDLLDAFIVESDKQRLEIARIGEGLWQMRSPYAYPVSAASIRDLLKRITDMRLASYVAEASPEALPRFGLEKPRLRVTLTQAASTITIHDEQGQATQQVAVDPQQLVLHIGDDISGTGFYCQYQDSIYQASNLSMGFLLRQTPDGYLSRQVLDIPLNMVRELRFMLPGSPPQHYQMALVEHILPNGDFALDELGNQLYDYNLSYEDSVIDPEPLASLYADLMRMESFGQVGADYAPEQHQALLTLQLEMADGLQREISFCPYDALHGALVINGHALYLVPLSSLHPIIATLQTGALYDATAQADVP